MKRIKCTRSSKLISLFRNVLRYIEFQNVLLFTILESVPFFSEEF